MSLPSLFLSSFICAVDNFIMAGWIQSTAHAMSFLLRVKVARKTAQRLEIFTILNLRLKC